MTLSGSHISSKTMRPRPVRSADRDIIRHGAQSAQRARCGFTLVEMIVSGILLAAVIATAAPLLSWAIAQRQLADQRLFAVQEIANVMEQLAVPDAASVTQESVNKIELSQPARDLLHDAQFAIVVANDAGPPAAKRVTFELKWKTRTGQFVSPVRLTRWFMRKEQQTNANATRRLFD